MTPRSPLFRHSDRDGKSGQMVVMFALCLIAIIAMAGLLIDGGNAWANRRQAQAAADTAALAGAVARSDNANAAGTAAAARTIAAANGFGAGNVDCAGTPLANGGVTVNWPPTSGPNAGDTGYVEVYTTRAMRTAFAGAVGFPCWMVSARAVASVITQVATCNFCALSDYGGDDKYVLLIDNGNDLRIDGDIFSNHPTWYGGNEAVNRCGGADPCSAATCGDWIRPGGATDNIRMCGHSIYVDHSGGGAGNRTILSARTIAAVGGWQARSMYDVIHADQLAADCPAHPKDMDWADPFLQETNVCIGADPIEDPLNDVDNNPSAVMPLPDYANLSTCPGAAFPCGPVASATCVAEPGSELRLPTGTFVTPHKLQLSGAANQKKLTICPGLYFGGFGTNGDGNGQPHVIMLPGTYVMVGGGFNVTGTASITSVSSQGDGVSIYNSGGNEAFSENFPSNTDLVPTVCPPPASSACKATGTPVLNPPSTASIAAGDNVQYKLVVPKGTFVGAPVPTGAAGSVKFYNGNDPVNPIVCTGGSDGVTFTATSLVAKCTTSYTMFGSKGITAVYEGDATYAAIAALKTQDVVPAPSASQDNVDLRTGSGPCAAIWNPVTDPCGQIILHAPTSGRYSGLLIFQDRAPGLLEGALAMLLQPYIGAPACDPTIVTTVLGDQPVWMADGVESYGPPFSTRPVPAPCGPLGGLSGTIYASHVNRLGASDWDAVVKVMGSGLANLQLIGAELDFTQGNPSHQARFAFDASLFANGKVRLVE